MGVNQLSSTWLSCQRRMWCMLRSIYVYLNREAIMVMKHYTTAVEQKTYKVKDRMLLILGLLASEITLCQRHTAKPCLE